MKHRMRMMASGILLAWVTAIEAGAGPPGAPSSNAAAPLLIVANKSADTVSFVNIRSMQVETNVPTGRGPHEVAVTPDGRLVFTANYEGPGDSISMISVKTRKEVKRIPLDPYRRPHGLAISRDGRMLYATCEANQAVIEIEIASEKISRTFPIGQRITHMLALAPDGKRLYASNILSGTVTVLDLAEGRVMRQISTGEGCEGLDVTPDGKELWATNREAGTISIIEVARDRVVGTLPCPGFPIRLKFTPDGRMALVSCYLEGSLAVFDVSSRTEIQRIRPGSPRLDHPIGLLIEPNGKRAFLSNSGADEVVVIDLQGLSIVSRIPAGKEPDGLGYALMR